MAALLKQKFASDSKRQPSGDYGRLGNLKSPQVALS
jgi:hypothetical protein